MSMPRDPVRPLPYLLGWDLSLELLETPIDDRFIACEKIPMPPLPRLGDLETAVLEHVWAKGPCDVKTVHRSIGAPRGITPNTVQSAMERLFRKGLLAREKVSHAYVYSPRQSREQVGARAIQDVVSRLLKGQAVPVLEAFVDLAARTDEANLDRLERLIAEKRKASR